MKKITAFIVRRVQFVAVTAALVVLYAVGFGLTRLWILLFRRSFFARRRLRRDSFWIKAEGYGRDPEESLRQS